MVSEIERATSALRGIPCPPDYDSWFRLLCAAKSAGVPRGDVINWCELGDGFKPAEFESKWKSIDANIGIGAGSLFQTAFDSGWKDPARTTHSKRNGSRPDIPLAEDAKAPHKAAAQAASADAAAVWSRCIPATPAEAYI